MEDQKVTWEVAVFTVIGGNCSSQVVKNVRAFSAVNQFLNLCQDGGK